MFRRSALVLAVTGALIASGSAWAVTVTPVMTGLDNPRGLAFGADGGLYVAEGGRGGSSPPCRVVRGMTQCFGATGAISRLLNGVQTEWISGLPSLAPPSGEEAEGGPQDIAFVGRAFFGGPGDAYVTMGLGGSPAGRAALGDAGRMMGKLWKFSGLFGFQEIADLAAYEGTVNPAGGPIDSNPYGVLATLRQQFVAEAGGNAVLTVSGRSLSTLAVFPARANPTPIGPPFVDSVPTAVALGPDGAFYVSELTGVPFLTGFARIHRIGSDGTTSVFASGLTTVVDLAFAGDGRLYALQHASCGPFFACPGSIVRVEASAPHTLVSGGLTRPSAFTIGPDGAFYVSNHGASAAVGEVLRIAP